MFRTVEYRLDYPSRPITSKGEALDWVARPQIRHAPPTRQNYRHRTLPAAPWKCEQRPTRRSEIK
ncbi:MAG TPA: hypothetical protein DDY43_13795 [Synechococcales bacterium UBA10510]|nr:hypothetical protein [Synechococcales bacterium UBA10510]